jgi:ribose transport system ATP-binding protein
MEGSGAGGSGQAPPAAMPLLRIESLSKHFAGAQRALDAVSLEVRHQEVHGLLGHNGSGKSTLIKVLAGFHAPDAGARIWLRGEEIALPMPTGRARELGISFVHQHLGLIPSLTVLENLLLGDIATESKWRIDWAREGAAASELFARYRIDLDPAATVTAISPVQRALLAIVRAFRDLRRSDGEGLLILDEPTPFLPRKDVDRLFALVRQVVAEGASVIFVSHDIDEVLDITDRATVLRDGRVAGAFDTRNTLKDDIVEMIVGHPLARQGKPSSSATQANALRVDGLEGAIVRDVSFGAAQGEIVGLTGLMGAGYDEVPYLLYGATPARSGTLQLQGGAPQRLSAQKPARAIAMGMVLIPGDRQNDAVMGTLSVAENLGMPVYGRVTRPWAISNADLNANALRLNEAFDVRPRDPALLLQNLSGGNQQKAVMAKWLQLEPRLILLDEPTQGVDVGAREQLFGHLRNAAARGAAIVVASSDFEQLETLCDRVLIFGHGRIAAELRGGAISKSAIADCCFGTETNGDEVTL